MNKKKEKKKRKKKEATRGQTGPRRRGDKPKPTVRFGRNSAKSGKIESGRKSGRQRDDDDEDEDEDAPGRSSRRVRSRRTTEHEPGMATSPWSKKKKLVRGPPGMMNRFY